MSDIHFVSGMPRSGSTLLCNILCQNPDFRATGTSPLPAILSTNIELWERSNEVKANYGDEDKNHFLRQLMEIYHTPFAAPTIFEKSRAWPAYVELLTQILQKRPKILVCTRAMPAIVSSFEKIWRKEIVKYGGIPQNMITLEDRVAYWSGKDQIIGSAYHSLVDTVQRGNKDCLLPVDFFDLTTNPKATLQRIHDFIEKPWFEYDFDNVEQKIIENDEFHGFSKDALHTIRRKVVRPTPDFYQVLGESISNELLKTDYSFLS